ncbi:MAG: N-6 DNA methylase [Brevefilum sp.]|jgi:type I restriction enzyme M protein
MLDSETKRRIDNARDILVGKVPDPKTQVEQITFAMIYKFMDDMDQISVKLGGKPSFFANGYEQFAWSKLMDTRLGGEARLDLYVRALDQMAQNPHIPQLFRDIFKGAFLPYRDSETLNLFLKEMNGFTYDHSEDLGDAYEYLLSIFATQGKAGQFRTPRHIIDFIVDCVDPDLNDSVLDPACGTAGFLISAYKHIEGKYKDNPLNPDQKQRLTENFVGYDISPDMVRLSRVNMYLHQFPNPTIYEYDTLTTEDRWEDSFDVILANPPFMTPKGGIRPHKRFAVRANRSEVLFVDYIAEHLNVGGRAGVIVPEGIIFQSSNAYKALRKMLVEQNYLYAVVSLPAGIFQPYSGVKTSILLLDKDLARGRDSVLFVRVENDGYDLGAQRRPIEENDLPEALAAVKAFQAEPAAELEDTGLAWTVSKARLGEDGDYNLSGERYREHIFDNLIWPMVSLGDERLFTIESGGTPRTSNPEYWDGDIPWVTLVDLPQRDFITSIRDTKRKITEKGLSNSSAKILPKKTVLVSSRATIGRIAINEVELATNQGFKNIIINDRNKVNEQFLALMMTSLVEKMVELGSGGTYKEISKSTMSKLQIPLPPLEVQQEIVNEIEGYQKVIDGARQVVENYKPVIPIDPDWSLVKLGEVCENLDSLRKPVSKSERKSGIYPYYGASGIVDYVDSFIFDGDFLLISEDGANLLARVTPIAFSISGKSWVNNHAHVLRFDNFVTQEFVKYLINNMDISNYVTGSAQPKLNQTNLNSISLALPDIDVQSKIVRTLTDENEMIQNNQRIVELFTTKIAARIQSVWGAG